MVRAKITTRGQSADGGSGKNSMGKWPITRFLLKIEGGQSRGIGEKEKKKEKKEKREEKKNSAQELKEII